VKLQVERNTKGHRPATFNDVSIEINANDVLRTKLTPQKQPRVTQKGPVPKVVRDVALKMIVVALSPEGSRE
jgi:hypothetical protein